ncbi:LOW QUALITY PROTEIN: Exo_endo_phos domain-containing protein/DUF4283 domain-containing protein, partial [Cephalotus follicularis]
SLQFFEPLIVDGIPRAKAPPKVCANHALEWEHALVAFLVGKKLPPPKVREVLLHKWGQVGSFSFHTVSNGVFFIKYESCHARDWVMDNCPWDIWWYHIALRKTKGMSLKLEECNSIPVWVKLSNIHVHLWSKLGLSYIASVLGCPLYMDAPTTNQQTLTFAKVCMDMLASSSFPNSIILDLDDGSSIVVGVEYPWIPQACSLCKLFHHANKYFPEAVKRQWLLKPVVEGCQKPDDAEGWITVKRKKPPIVTELVPVGDNHVGGEIVVQPHQAPKTPIKGGRIPHSIEKTREPTSTSPDTNPLGSKVVHIDGGCNMMDNNRGKAKCVETDSPLAGSTSGGSKKKKNKVLNVWNVRGLNNPSKHREVSHFILSNKISLLVLLETRLRESNVNHVVKSIRRQWNFCSNHNASLPGRIVVVWDSAHIVFVPICVNEQALHGKVTLPNMQEFCVSFIYGLCDSRTRKQLWNDTIFYANRFKKTPWSMLGDFNVTRFSHEHSNSCRVTKAMEDFNCVIRSAELDDLKSTGLNFTWNNMRSGTAAISKKLDRALGNWKWFKHFGDSYAHTYNPGISDHSPLSIQMMQQVQSSGRPFKFLNFWADHPEFLNIVRHEWAKSYEGPPLRKIQLKLTGVKCQLKELSTRHDTLTADLRQKLK